MADWSALTRGFQEGADWRQDFRARRQNEKARDQALEKGEYDLESRRAVRKTRHPDAAAELGSGYADENVDWGGQLVDPFAFKLGDWFKSKFGRKKQAIPTGEPTAPPPDMQAAGVDAGAVQTFPIPDYADGGSLSEEDKIRKRAEANRRNNPGKVERATENVEGADRTAKAGRTAIEAPGKKSLLRRAANSKVGKVAGALATAGAVANATDDDYDERAMERFGWDRMAPTEPSVGGALEYGGKRALMFASDLGNNLTGGLAGKLFQDQPGGQPAAAPAPMQGSSSMQPQAGAPLHMSMSSGNTMSQRSAMPAQQQQEAPSDMVDFSDLDVDAKEVPDMKTDDWKKYRAQMIAAAQKSGEADAVGKVNDMVTDMQQKGFINYGKQGLALQQAGNARGAMAAYRAAFQYFPNGNDVEFGIHKDKKTGRAQIVGFGLSEKTGKVVPGTELIMDPERVAVLLENFQNPQAFRMWTKDWRDFKQDEREYTEIKKPLAQAQADALANNSEASIVRAENAASGGAGAGAGGATMRNAERVFRERLGMMGLQDETQADYLASVMSQVKAANPNIPDNTIVQVIMTAAQDGTLAQRLQRMGIGRSPSPQQAPPAPAAAAAPPRTSAIPMGMGPSGGPNTPDNPRMSPERLAEYDKYARR